jgi:hypothetical protein
MIYFVVALIALTCQLSVVVVVVVVACQHRSQSYLLLQRRSIIIMADNKHRQQQQQQQQQAAHHSSNTTTSTTVNRSPHHDGGNRVLKWVMVLAVAIVAMAVITAGTPLLVSSLEIAIAKTALSSCQTAFLSNLPKGTSSKASSNASSKGIGQTRY